LQLFISVHDFLSFAILLSGPGYECSNGSAQPDWTVISLVIVQRQMAGRSTMPTPELSSASRNFGDFFLVQREMISRRELHPLLPPRSS
jgi:hypothetical protein